MSLHHHPVAETRVSSAATGTEIQQIDALIHELTEQRNLLVAVGRERRVGSHWIHVREDLDVQRATTLLAAYRLFEIDALHEAYEQAALEARIVA